MMTKLTFEEALDLQSGLQHYPGGCDAVGLFTLMGIVVVDISTSVSQVNRTVGLELMLAFSPEKDETPLVDFITDFEIPELNFSYDHIGHYEGDERVIASGVVGIVEPVTLVVFEFNTNKPVNSTNDAQSVIMNRLYEYLDNYITEHNTESRKS